MCTRLALDIDCEAIKHSLATCQSLQIDAWDDANDFQPRYNIGEKMGVPVILHRASKNPSGGGVEPSFFMRRSQWGLVPGYRTVRANQERQNLNLVVPAEDVVNNERFGKIARTQSRCAVVCKGYYSFPTSKAALPSYVRRQDGHLLLLAGICASAIIDGNELHSFTIITTEVGGGLPGKRQPLMLWGAVDTETWLTQPEWMTLLGNAISTPHDKAPVSLESYNVPEGVRKLNAESSSFVQPIETRPDGITKAFKNAQKRQKRQAERSPERTPSPLAVTSTSSSRVAPHSSSKKLRLTSPRPSPHKVPTTPSKPLRVTQVNRASPSPTPSSRRACSSGHALGRNSKCAIEVQYVPSEGEGEDDSLQDVASFSEDEDDGVQYISSSSSSDGHGAQEPNNAAVGRPTYKGKRRQMIRVPKPNVNAAGQSKYFS